jgi:hypothetical protein
MPVEWHRFLYRSVLLEWETALHQRKHFLRFNGRKPLAGINLVKVDSLPAMLQWVNNQASTPKPSECLVFYSKGTTLKDLFRLVRNCVAHGHYSAPRYGWIQLHHNHQGKLTLTGQVKFSNLKSLVASIAGGDLHLENGNA